MLRSNRLLLLLAMLFVAPGVACAEDRKVTFSVADTYPALSGQLRAGSRLYIKLSYRSDGPVGFHIDGYAAGKKVPGASSNIAPPYPAGEGEALVWIGYPKPATIDELRITAIDQRWQPLASISQPAPLEWSAAPANNNGPPPAWVQRLDSEQQERAKQQTREFSEQHMYIGELIIQFGFLSVLAYLVLQPMTIAWLPGGWRIAAFVPLVAMVPLFIVTAYAFAQASNLWPLALIFLTPFATLYLLVLAGVHWLVTRKTHP